MATTKKTGFSPGQRIQIGNNVIAALGTKNTQAIEERLATFRRSHDAYVGAQTKLDRAEARLTTTQEKLAQLDIVQDELVDQLNGAAMADKQSLAKFSAYTPGALRRLPYVEEAKELERIAAAMQRDPSLSKTTKALARRAYKQAKAVQAAAQPLAKIEQAVREARQMRDLLAEPWDSGYAGLKLAAGNADRDAGTNLAATIGDATASVRPKKVKRATAKAAPPSPPESGAGNGDSANASQ
jgi:hypothetical protein